MDRVAALVLAGGRSGDFGALSEHRTKAAFPIAGYYRIIDFALSNLCYAGIRQAGIIIQYMPASLMEHIGSGRAWQFDMADRSLRFMTPFVGVDEIRWFHGTGDAISKNMNLLNLDEVDDILILSGEHVYTMDYRRFVEHHRQSGADVTFSVVEIPPERQNPRFGNVVVRDGGRVEAFIEKPERPASSLVSMGIYCFKRDVLMDLMSEMAAQGQRDFSLAGDLLAPGIGRLNAQAWIFRDPWHYLANLQEYYDFHMQLAAGKLDFLNPNWNVITNFMDRALSSRVPTFFAPECEVDSSVISSGCRIHGTVTGSVLSPGVMVGRGAVVRNSVIFHDVKIGEGCHLENVIVDKDVVFGDGARVSGAASPDGSASGIQVIGKGCRIGRGEVLAPSFNDASMMI